MPLPPTALAGLRPVPDPDAPEPDADDKGGAPDQDTDDVKPDWVDYATEAENCKNCSFMDQGGNCAVLNMPVGPDDHCNAFSPKQSGTEPGQEQPSTPDQEEQPQQ